MKVRLLLSTQRSGSHFLKSYIEGHFPSCICSSEILEQPDAAGSRAPVLSSYPETPLFWSWYGAEVAAGHISAAPDKKYAALEYYIRHLVTLTEPQDLLLDIKYNSIRSMSGYWDTEYGSNDFVSFINHHQIPVLHLIRKNILRTIVSNRLAQATGVWHRWEDRPVQEILPRFRLNPKAVLYEIRYAINVKKDYQNRFAGHPGYEEVIYEDFVREQDFAEPGTNMRSVAFFLEQAPVRATPQAIPYKKTTPDDPAEVVENWGEIVRVLRGTEHGWMTQSPLLAAA